MKKIVLGIDIGGTNTKLGLIDPQGTIFSEAFFSTGAYSQQKTALINQIVQSSQELMQKNGLSSKNIFGIGIGLPGLINARQGVVHSLTNIPGWHNVRLKHILEKQLRTCVFIDNDVNVITLGEWRYGAGQGKKNIICVTLGTGIGGGLILENQLYRGEGFAAGEIGHVPIMRQGRRCNCGGRGCLETFTAHRYLHDKAQKIFRKSNFSLEKITALAKQGDARAKHFWRQVGQDIGIGLTGIVNVFNPSCIVMGGGISKAFPYMRQSILETIRSRAMRVQGRMVKLAKSTLGSRAGIMGAKVLVEQEKQSV